MNRHRNPLDERWSLNTVRWLETGPYAHVPAVRRLADELRHFEGPRTATEYRLLKGKIERVFKALEGRRQLDPEDDPAAITRALLEGSLGIAESGVARPMPGTRQGPLRDIEERHPQAGRRQREREAQAARQQLADLREAATLPPQDDVALLQQGVRAIHDLAHLTSTVFRITAPYGTGVGTNEFERGRRQAQIDATQSPRGFVEVVATLSSLIDAFTPGEDHAFFLRGYATGANGPGRAEEDSLVKEWNLGYDLDGGGYSFERVRGTPLGSAIEILLHEQEVPLDSARRAVGSMLMWDSPDLDYIIGSDDLPRHRADLLLIAPGRGRAMPWPDKIPEPDAEGNLGNLMFEKRADGELYETDHQCSWCEGTGHVRPEGAERFTCTRCDGDGTVNSPGGAWAIYERVEIEEEEEEEEGDPDELLTIDLDSDEIDLLQGWHSGQGDPLYALQSSGSIRRGDISSATSNLSTILRRSELGEAVLDGEDDVATINDLIAKLERAARRG